MWCSMLMIQSAHWHVWYEQLNSTFISPTRITSMRRYRSPWGIQIQKMQQWLFMPLPAFPQTHLPRWITPPSSFKDVLTCPNPATLLVNILQWRSANPVRTTRCSNHLQTRLSTHYSATHSSNKSALSDNDIKTFGYLTVNANTHMTGNAAC